MLIKTKKTLIPNILYHWIYVTVKCLSNGSILLLLVVTFWAGCHCNLSSSYNTMTGTLLPHFFNILFNLILFKQWLSKWSCLYSLHSRHFAQFSISYLKLQYFSTSRVVCCMCIIPPLLEDTVYLHLFLSVFMDVSVILFSLHLGPL